MEFILGFIFLVLAIAIGVWLGVGSLRPERDYSDDYYLGRLNQIGLISKEEYKEVSSTRGGRRAKKNAQEKLRKTLVELKELDYLTEAELEEKLTLLDQIYGN